MDDIDVYPFLHSSLIAILLLSHYKIVQTDHDIKNKQPVHYFHLLEHKAQSLLLHIHLL